MNEKNLEYLQDNLKYMGFGEKQHEILAQQVKDGKESFQLVFNTEVNKKPFEAVLQFRRSDNTDMYFFNSYRATLERSNGQKMEQTFYLTKGRGVTAKEAYNLLEGRSVFKELTNKAGDPYKAWIQLDFANADKNNNHEVKQFHENFGYDLQATLSQYAIAELKDPEKERSLMQSLQKGNLQAVSVEKSDGTSKIFIEANPQFKTLNVYDEKFKRVPREELSKYLKEGTPVNVAVSEKQDQKKTKSEKKELNNSEPSKKKNTRKRGMKI